MKRSSGPDDSPPEQREHGEGPKVMSFQHYSPKVHVARGSNYSSVSRSVNETPTSVADIVFSTAIEDHSVSSGINSSTTPDYEQLSREFYSSYDPSIGLHTAAVLGGILVWLVIYVIYRTKVRKCVIKLFKKKCGDEEAEEVGSKKFSDSGEKDSASVVSPNMVRPFINPSIVIDSTPPESSPQSPGTYDQFIKPGVHECQSPYSLHGNNEEGYFFQFPHGALNGHNQFQLYHQQFCQEAADLQHQQQYLQQLPVSEMDIPTATAQWVQNMPLAARSHQDFAGLLLAMQSRGLLSMNKPCSCPLVCPRSPQPLPLLDLPSTWNKSLPVLSSSLSSQLLSAYETVTGVTKGHKDIKDIINAKRKQFNKHKNKNGSSRHREHIEYTKLEQQPDLSELVDSNASQMKKPNKSPPNLTILIPDTKDNFGAVIHRSPVPIPVTPTVMIQNSQQAYRRYAGCDSNSSVTSSSSTDFHCSAPRHKSLHSTIPSPHLLSPQCDNRLRGRGNATQFSWSKEDVFKLCDKSENRGSSPLPLHWHQCSFSKHGHCGHKKADNGQTSTHGPRPNATSEGISVVSKSTLALHPNESNSAVRCGHKRTLSDYNKYYTDLMRPHGAISQTPGQQHKRSLSADITYALSQQREMISPTCSNESNKNSLGTSSYSHSPSPHLLQVPDPNNLRAFTPDVSFSNNCQQSGYEPQSGPRQYVHSDSNISYYCDCSCQSDTGDNQISRRHSAYAPPIQGEMNLSFCVDNSVRATSSFGSSTSHTSPQHISKHKHSCHHRAHRHQTSHDPTRHHSMGTLAQDCAPRTVLCGQVCTQGGAQSGLNRSFSAVIMETKL